MTSMDIEAISLTELVGDLNLPCDYAEEPACPDQPAEWVLYRNPCCPGKTGAALACATCKENRLMDAFSLECDLCGHIFDHAPDAYSYIEYLNKRPSS